MKKILIASLITLATVSASALEVGVNVGRIYDGVDPSTVGGTLSQQFGKFNAAVGVDRHFSGDNHQSRFSLIGGYDFLKLGEIVLTAKSGVTYINNQHTEDGYAVAVGVGASVPLTKSISGTLDVRKQFGQDSVKESDGALFNVGLRYKF